MGARGPGSRKSRLLAMYGPPPPTLAETRQAAAIERLTNLARGLGLKIEPASYGRVAIVAPIKLIEAVILSLKDA